jgi:hypothetical protein
VGLGHSLDQAVKPETAQVIRHLAGRVLVRGSPQQLRNVRADIPMAEAGGAEGKQTQGLHEGQHAPVAEAEARGALGIDDDRLRYGFEEVIPDQRVVAQIFDVQEASVGGEADLPQGGQIA